MADLVARLAAAGSSAPRVDEFWALDSVHQGDSGVLNDGLLGETFSGYRKAACGRTAQRTPLTPGPRLHPSL